MHRCEKAQPHTEETSKITSSGTKNMAFISETDLRANFSAAMSAMYRTEVPAYGQLIDLVAKTNATVIHRQSDFSQRLQAGDGLARLSAERHGAIRLGSAEELAMMRRLFALMGMYPVDYYDLSVAGIPVHSTAFRPITLQALNENPFRVFTSLLRLDLISDDSLRDIASSIISKRQIFSTKMTDLIEKAEVSGGVPQDDANAFIAEALMIFKWRQTALVSKALYKTLHDTHRLIADIVSFPGPHINHLTPRTLDIDAAQTEMHEVGLNAKAVIEGPPKRACPILLRQTSFKALEETVKFQDGITGAHTARFGEIEQRGAALTPKGRTLYDTCLARARDDCAPAADGSNAQHYQTALDEAFKEFPDDWHEMEAAKLAYFYRDNASSKGTLIPVIYEDFLPVSAAGIFQSNLGDNTTQKITASSNQKLFETALGTAVADPFALYAALASENL